MTDVRGLTVEAVALKVLADRVAARQAQVKAELAQVLDPGDRKSATLASGVTVGAVTFTKSTTKARLVNEQQLLRWVEENSPDDIVATIRPSYLAALLSQAQKNGAPVTEHGEIIPGVDIVHADGYLSVRPDLEQLPALTEAIRASRELALGGES